MPEEARMEEYPGDGPCGLPLLGIGAEYEKTGVRQRTPSYSYYQSDFFVKVFDLSRRQPCCCGNLVG